MLQARQILAEHGLRLLLHAPVALEELVAEVGEPRPPHPHRPW